MRLPLTAIPSHRGVAKEPRWVSGWRLEWAPSRDGFRGGVWSGLRGCLNLRPTDNYAPPTEQMYRYLGASDGVLSRRSPLRDGRGFSSRDASCPHLANLTITGNSSSEQWGCGRDRLFMTPSGSASSRGSLG